MSKTPDQKVVELQKEIDTWRTKYNRVCELIAPWADPDDYQRELWERVRSGKAPRKFCPDRPSLTKIYQMASIQCTQKEIAAELGISDEYFSDLKKEYPEVMMALDSGREAGKVKLRLLQHNQAQDSVPMSIHLGKNILGQSDKVQQEHTGNLGLLTMLMSLPDDREIIETIEGPANVFVPQPLKGDTE